MSTALASARRRRAGPEPASAQNTRQTAPPPPIPSGGQPNMGVGLTLPQVIAVVDKRLITLESYMNSQPKNDGELSSEDIKGVLEEFNSRFDIIADEIATMKDLIMKLQSYTMEVNKTLLEERVRILTDAPTPLERALESSN
jgi:hypothetical protein